MRFCQLQIAPVEVRDQLTSRRSSGVEHFLGREGVMSSILIDGSIYNKTKSERILNNKQSMVNRL
jgi:hypothetical protein